MIHDTLVRGREYTVLSLPPISVWALLVAGKDIESRSCTTTRRGRVLIHASGESMTLREIQARRAELSFLSGLSAAALPSVFARRAILGSVEIVDCIDDAPSKWAVPGKHHWLLRDPWPLRTPIEDIEGEDLFWSWTYEPQRAANSGRARTPLRSGIVPAVHLPDGASSQHPTATAQRKRGAE